MTSSVGHPARSPSGTMKPASNPACCTPLYSIIVNEGTSPLADNIASASFVICSSVPQQIVSASSLHKSENSRSDANTAIRLSPSSALRRSNTEGVSQERSNIPVSKFSHPKRFPTNVSERVSAKPSNVYSAFSIMPFRVITLLSLFASLTAVPLAPSTTIQSTWFLW